ncbi:hypothetical protein MVEN_00613600 [Mycena venus]|uniref:Uncharacterized protein n=1 Tax=Mycena venus TaxID=2733690 RepID=A0A8H6YRJ3_9AGAR|nr:hypothetical protein MVEN_00613600 [Mycena venus]
MILLEDKVDTPTPSSSSLSPNTQYSPASPGYYSNSSHYAPSSSAGSSSLRAPPAWHTSSSDTALPIAGSPPPSFPPLSTTHSHSYLPVSVKPAEPPSLTRLPPSNLPRTSFQPMFLLAEGNSLSKGFPYAIPPTSVQPHPFSIRDVNETDWTQFLTELRTIARLTEKDKNIAYSVPILSAIPVINFAIAEAITSHIRRKKASTQVILMKGQVKLSGQSDQPVANLYTPRTVNFKPPARDF